MDGDIDGIFSDRATLHNYKTSKKFINLNTDDPDESRLLKKALSAAQGGIIHRGSNEFFINDGAEDLANIRRWINAEISVADIEGKTRGVVYARRPPALRDLFDVGAWNPGADLWSLVPATASGVRTNLTAAHHTGPADIRTPEVSPDGTEVMFAMRKSVTDCLNLYKMNIDGTNLEQLTDDTGVKSRPARFQRTRRRARHSRRHQSSNRGSAPGPDRVHADHRVSIRVPGARKTSRNRPRRPSASLRRAQPTHHPRLSAPTGIHHHRRRPIQKQQRGLKIETL